MRGNFRLIVLMTLLAALLVACGGGTKPTPQEQKFGQLEINVRGTDIGLWKETSSSPTQPKVRW